MVNHNRAALNRLYRGRNRDVPTWCIMVETPQLTTEDRERVAREDRDIAERRAAFPLH